MLGWATLNYSVECLRTHDDIEWELPKGALIEVTRVNEYELYFNDTENVEYYVEGESPESLYTLEPIAEQSVSEEPYKPVPNMTPMARKYLLL